MRRLKVLLIVVCLVVTMAGLTLTASAWYPVVGGTIPAECQFCGFIGSFTITSYRQATLASSGVMSVS